MGGSGLLTPGRLRNLSLGHLVNQHLEIDENLAADFDGSFSGLGVDINASNYSMSDALMALPNLSISTSQIFKQEAWKYAQMFGDNHIHLFNKRM